MRTGTTKSGFEYVIDDERLNDMCLVETLAIVIDEKAAPFSRLMASSELLTIILGSEQKKALYDFIKAENDGRVPMESITEFFEDILGGPGKN